MNVKWIAGGDLGLAKLFLTSTDGINWVQIGDLTDQAVIWSSTNGIKSNNSGAWVAVGVGSIEIWDNRYFGMACLYSNDNGQTWTNTKGENGAWLAIGAGTTLNSVDYNGTYVAVGTRKENGGSTALLLKSSGGILWIHEYTPIISNGDTDLELYDVKWTGKEGGWLAVGKLKHNGNVCYIYHSPNTDATNWSPLNWPYGNTYIPKEITTYGTRYYLSNKNSYKIFASGENWNTSTLTEISTNMSNRINLLITNCNRLIAGGKDTSHPLMYSDDGITFINSTIENNENPEINTISKIVNNKLIAGSLDGRLYLSSDNGVYWSVVFNGGYTTAHFHSIDYTL